MAPTTLAYVYPPRKGVSKVVPETSQWKEDGDWGHFTP